MKLETLLAQQKHCHAGDSRKRETADGDYCTRPCKRCDRCKEWRSRRNGLPINK